MRIDFEPGVPAAAGAARPVVDLEPLVATVSRQLHGEVDEQRIRCEMQRLLERDFAQARITAYLPIFLARGACEALRADLARAAAGGRR